MTLLDAIGITISKRQVVRLLIDGQDRFQAEAKEVLRAGLADAAWVTVDVFADSAVDKLEITIFAVDVLRVATLTIPCLSGLWTAVACRRAQYHGLPGSDALVWAGLSGAFFLPSLMKTARGLGLVRVFADFLHGIFKQRGWYTASIAVAVVVITALFAWGLMWTWHRIKRYRLAVGFAGLSLHEVDAWNANVPWARTAVDLVAAAGVSAVAIARLCQLRSRKPSPKKLLRRRTNAGSWKRGSVVVPFSSR